MLSPPRPPRFVAFSPSGYRVRQRAYRLDGDIDDVARLEEPRRIEADAHAGAGAGRDQVARFERHHVGNRLDQRRDVEYELAHVSILAHLAVYFREQPKLRDVFDLVGRHDARPHRAVAVETFPEEPLLVAVLERARGRVVHDRVAVDVLVG